MDDEIWEYYRNEAINWSVLRDQSFRMSQISYKRGDGSKAKEYSDQGKYYKQLCDEANKLAANQIFNYFNENRPFNEIDLHGLFVNEALEILTERVIDALANDVHQLDVIVGQGHHSDDGPKIKPSVELFAKNNGVQFSYCNPGRIRFNFGPKRKLSTTTERVYQQSRNIHVSGSKAAKRVYQPSNEIHVTTGSDAETIEHSGWILVFIFGLVFIGLKLLLGY